MSLPNIAFLWGNPGLSELTNHAMLPRQEPGQEDRGISSGQAEVVHQQFQQSLSMEIVGLSDEQSVYLFNCPPGKSCVLLTKYPHSICFFLYLPLHLKKSPQTSFQISKKTSWRTIRKKAEEKVSTSAFVIPSLWWGSTLIRIHLNVSLGGTVTPLTSQALDFASLMSLWIKLN